MARGDHIFVRRGFPTPYTHHGIDCGDGTVIHYRGSSSEKLDGVVVRTSREQFARGNDIQVREYGSCLSSEDVVARAESRLGQRGYSLFSNNCEHFVTRCKTSAARSEQVSDATNTVGGAAAAGVAVAAGVGVVATTGAVAGLSGPGIMSGLAATGSIVGTGAVGGFVAAGAVPAAAAIYTVRQILPDDPALPDAERTARTAGRCASVGGALAGTAGSIGLVSASGAVDGLSGAGITSGLAAIGGPLGMVGGVACTAALPAVAALGVGYGIYKLFQWAAN